MPLPTTRSAIAAAVLAAAVAAPTGAAAAVPAAAAAPAAAPPAAAANSARQEAHTPLGPAPNKAVTASCPDGTTVYGMGGQVVGAAAGVVLTAIVPDSTLKTVLVTASARSGAAGDWGLAAYAVCGDSVAPAYLVQRAVSGSGEVEAGCRDHWELLGAGFRLAGDVDHAYVSQLSFEVEPATVLVRAGGSGTPQSLAAVAICKPLTGSVGQRLAVASVVHGWPKTVAVVDDQDRTIYAVGGAVIGAPGYLTGLVPDGEHRRGIVTADRVDPVNPSASRSGSDPDGVLVAYADAMGTFY
jgi:hypothetical protein